MYAMRTGKTFLVFFLLLGACSTYVAKVDEESAARLLNFVRDGQTTRQEVTARLGEPHQSFETGRIVTYVITDADGSLTLLESYHASHQTTPDTGLYHLVLVFGPTAVLERHSLVRVR